MSRLHGFGGDYELMKCAAAAAEGWWVDDAGSSGGRGTGEAPPCPGATYRNGVGNKYEVN